MVISLRLNDRLSRKIATVAKERGISKSELIRRCLDEYLADAEQGPTAWDLSVRAEEVARERMHARRKKSRR